MESRDRLLVRLYLLIALGALAATWSQNIRFFLQEDNGGLWGFVKATYANPAAASITNDVIFVLLAAWLLMWVEARRLHIPHVWIYFVLSGVIAISFAFPLFLAVRQRKLAETRPHPTP